jgi:N6-L-threonylcarbamoyladenine synthase
MKILAIETSCDETACAVVENGVNIICSVVASSKEFHEKTEGIVPEVASRKQLEYIVPVLDETVHLLMEKEKRISFEDAVRSIDALAVTVGPGLIGSLLIGVEVAKTLSILWNKPLIPVNHLVGHVYANFIGDSGKIKLPALAMVVSGGHTDMILLKDHGVLTYLGGTLDDAAGEAFDKTARLLGISKYLGGVALSKKAAECTYNSLKGVLPRPMISSPNYDFSFSGLKTAVKRLVEGGTYPVEVVAREFEESVVEVLVTKICKAVNEFGIKTVLLGGGVAANTTLRSQLGIKSKEADFELFIPPVSLCTDNAVYIAAAAYFLGSTKKWEISEINANPSLGIMDEV